MMSLVDDFEQLTGRKAMPGERAVLRLCEIPDQPMTDFRCSNCNRLLAKVESGKVQIKCKCGTMNLYEPKISMTQEQLEAYASKVIEADRKTRGQFIARGLPY